MTAVVHPLTRNGWSTSNGSDINDMSTDDVSRMFVPRKSAQRPNSSSSSASSSTTTSTNSVNTQVNGVQSAEASWATKKKPARGLWPSSSKAEPVAGLSTARPQSVPANSPGTSAASAVSALHTPSTILSPQTGPQTNNQQNGSNRVQNTSGRTAMLHLQPLNGTFERKTIVVPFVPDLLRIGRQTNQKTVPTQLNGYFDSKVLSRQHAEIWAERDGKIWIRDVKSSNGTFVNGKRLSQENRDSEPHPLKEADILELGIDIVSEDQKTVVHHKVAARVDHAGLYGARSNALDLGSADIDAAPISSGSSQSGIPVGRPRPTSQASNANNGRPARPGTGMGGAALVPGLPTAPYHAKWLQPVTIEQIVKRLNRELKQAKDQSTNLQNTGSVVEAMALNGKSVNPSSNNLSSTSPNKHIAGVRNRFPASPPAPPPTQPLPEAPNSSTKSKSPDSSQNHPVLKRSDTEKPNLSSLDNATDESNNEEQSSQILNLVEALNSAQKQIEIQTEKLSEMQTALSREREERRIAEERAEKARTEEHNIHPTETDPAGDMSKSLKLDTEANRDMPVDLSQRIETMRLEMDGMKWQMEQYRVRAENAEEESSRDRQSLFDMVERLSRRENAKKRKAAKRTSRSVTEDTKDAEQQDEDASIENIDKEIEAGVRQVQNRLREKNELEGDDYHALNGSATSTVSISELQQLGKATIAAALSSNKPDTDTDQQNPATKATPSKMTQKSRTHNHLVHGAPYASLIGVVLLGVGMMAYLNGWQKVTER